MVIAGMRKRNTHGASMNRASRVAYPLSIILRLPLKTQRNNPLAIKNTIMTTNPESELRNDVISFLNRENICRWFYYESQKYLKCPY